MYHYLFTNDLRISKLNDSLIAAANCYVTDTVPSASEDKNRNNNMMTLGFYFNLTKESNAAAMCSKGKVRETILNFIKKFQFPNPRTDEHLKEEINDGITLAPLRTIVKMLYFMSIICPEQAYLTETETLDFIFYNSAIAKEKSPDILSNINDLLKYRKTGEYPHTISLNPEDRNWKHQDRQIGEMMTVLLWSGCVSKNKAEQYYICDSSLTKDNKAYLYELLNYNDFWIPEIGKTYAELRESYQEYMDIEGINDSEEDSHMFFFFEDFESDLPRNRIFFGAPGTGKSYTLNKEKDELLKNGGKFERVTFHPEYTYANFVGTYKPVPVGNAGSNEITYKYVPGPFMRMYVEAIKSGKSGDTRPHLLLIEEINRANVAAVFGDIFQLLDRQKDGTSEYVIQTSEDVRNYLADKLGGEPEDYKTIGIPNNMFIWASMNSADQGVFPMDTAFKRRWDFKYIGIDHDEDQIDDYFVKAPFSAKWNNIRKAINYSLSVELGVNEDKLIGPFFISKELFESGTEEEINKKFSEAFKNKVLMYLFEDAAKQKRPSLFQHCAEPNRYSEVCKKFDEAGIGLFSDETMRQFNRLEGKKK